MAIGGISQTVFYGGVINPQSLSAYAALPRCLLAVGPSGNIDWIVDDVAPHDLQTVLATNGSLESDLIELKDGEFLMPGFVDTHTHAPQNPNIGTGQQYELLDWLDNVTFPMESKFWDVEFARRTYANVVRGFIDVGTTTCCYYATLHSESTKALADVVYAAGQRGFIGKCNMNRNSAPNYTEPSPDASIAATKDVIDHIRALPQTSSLGSPQPLVQPILTPRFAISCTGPLLSALGDLAASDPALLIQTHISENKLEIAETLSLFPEAKSYAGVYDQFGLLREGTILAHGVHLSEDEVSLIKSRGSGISHCPTSNFNIRSGIAPIGRYLDEGVRVGLGTDVSGGYSNSILTEIRNASIASKILQYQSARTATGDCLGVCNGGHVAASSTSSESTGKFENKQLPISALLYLATLGGASLCRLDSHIGSFAPGKGFDALIVSPSARPIGLWGSGERNLDHDMGSTEVERKHLDTWLERFLFCGDDRNIDRVYVQGRWVGGRSWRVSGKSH